VALHDAVAPAPLQVRRVLSYAVGVDGSNAITSMGLWFGVYSLQYRA
jgi:hypothetical protein